MSGDRAVGWTALFVAGWVAGQWTSGREALGQGTQPYVQAPATAQQCAKRVLRPEPLPDSRKAARTWAQRYLMMHKDGVILK